MSANELGSCLRSRREAVTPADVGLPAGGRRRTPGLRRTELAVLAGISVEYLTRLEQGRDRNPSPQVLGALAEALRMTTGERWHLLHAAKESSGDSDYCPSAQPPPRTAGATVRALLDRLEPTPAAVLNRLSEVLARNAAFERLTGPVGLLDGQVPSLVRFLFTDPRARGAYPDWDRVADDRVAALKTAGSSDAYVTQLVDELAVTAGAAFTDRWAVAGPVRPGGVERLVHPEAGELRLLRQDLMSCDEEDLRLFVHLPADDASSAALDRLTGRSPGALRAVSAG